MFTVHFKKVVANETTILVKPNIYIKIQEG